MFRTRISQLLVAGVLSLVVMGCGQASPESAASPAAAAAAPSPAGERRFLSEASLPSGDCPLLSEAALRRHFPKAPAEIETRVRDKTYPSCTYRWVSATPRKAMMAGQEVEIGGEGRVTITIAPIRAPESDWQRVLSSYRIEPPVAVDGIGDKAVWSDQRHQLSVLVPGWVAHVAVEDDDSPGTGREQAVAVARDVLAGL
jgi:hypothetical protein